MSQLSQNEIEDIFGPAISVYTRSQAIEDGVLVDEPIKTIAKSYGINFNCAMTSDLFEKIQPSKYEDISGIICDLLTIFRMSVLGVNLLTGRSTKTGELNQGERFRFKFMKARKYIEVHVVFSVEDVGPCWTFMLPHED